jgi:hypothetical protein
MKDWLSRLFVLFAGSNEQQLRRFIEWGQAEIDTSARPPSCPRSASPQRFAACGRSAAANAASFASRSCFGLLVQRAGKTFITRGSSFRQQASGILANPLGLQTAN